MFFFQEEQHNNDEENNAQDTVNTEATTSGNDETRTTFENTVLTAEASQTIRRRKNPPELVEAGKYVKEAITTLNTVLGKHSRPHEEDDCDLYGKMLAKKLRKLPEVERLHYMYEIDGLFLRQLNRAQNHVYASTPTRYYAPSPSPSTSATFTYEQNRPHSSTTAYSDSSCYSSHSEHPIQHPPVIHISESYPITTGATCSTNTESSIIITSNNLISTPTEEPFRSEFSDIISKALHNT